MGLFPSRPFSTTEIFLPADGLPWKDPALWTVRDFERLGEVLNEYLSRERGRAGPGMPPPGHQLPPGMMMPPGMLPPEYAGLGGHPHPNGAGHSGSASSRRQLRREFDRLHESLDAQLRRMAAEYNRHLAERDALLFGTEAERRKELYRANMLRNLVEVWPVLMQMLGAQQQQQGGMGGLSGMGMPGMGAMAGAGLPQGMGGPPGMGIGGLPPGMGMGMGMGMNPMMGAGAGGGGAGGQGMMNDLDMNMGMNMNPGLGANPLGGGQRRNRRVRFPAFEDGGFDDNLGGIPPPPPFGGGGGGGHHRDRFRRRLGKWDDDEDLFGGGGLGDGTPGGPRNPFGGGRGGGGGETGPAAPRRPPRGPSDLDGGGHGLAHDHSPFYHHHPMPMSMPPMPAAHSPFFRSPEPPRYSQTPDPIPRPSNTPTPILTPEQIHTPLGIPTTHLASNPADNSPRRQPEAHIRRTPSPPQTFRPSSSTALRQPTAARPADFLGTAREPLGGYPPGPATRPHGRHVNFTDAPEESRWTGGLGEEKGEGAI